MQSIGWRSALVVRSLLGACLGLALLTPASPLFAQASCADSTRTIALSGSAACRSFDQDPTSCAAAWAVTQTNGIAVSCFYAQSSCQGCGPTNQANGACTNTCAAGVPALEQSPLYVATALMLLTLGILAARRRVGRAARIEL